MKFLIIVVCYVPILFIASGAIIVAGYAMIYKMRGSSI